jgi:hypothetical protein
MEVSQEQLIDVGLNVIGFLAAGGLLLLISSFFRRDRTTKPAAEVVSSGEPGTVLVDLPENDNPAPDLEFVSFTPLSEETDDRTTESVTQRPSTEVSRRDRSEVIRMAREMIKARRSTEEITDELPLSEAELAMLSRNNTGIDGEDNG